MFFFCSFFFPSLPWCPFGEKHAPLPLLPASLSLSLPLSLSSLTSGATLRQSASFLRSLASPEVTEM